MLDILSVCFEPIEGDRDLKCPPNPLDLPPYSQYIMESHNLEHCFARVGVCVYSDLLHFTMLYSLAVPIEI